MSVSDMGKDVVYYSALGFALLIGFGGPVGLCIYSVGLLLGVFGS